MTTDEQLPADYTATDNLCHRSVRPTASFSAAIAEAAKAYDPIDVLGLPAGQRVVLDKQDDALRASLAMLQEGDRSAMELVFFQGFEYAAAAAELGIPTGSLKTRIARSLHRLRDRLGIEFFAA
ncbi:MAG TPA: sigma factor-like helix-turn-helix DNA-binding protein [Pirellulaceae bacterium]|nr:sigma factor-like helix-turn-helix DNA-binding protein [Pirellulaceae bacterium]